MFELHIQGDLDLARALNALPKAVEKRTVAVALKAGAEPIRGMAAANMKRSATPHAARESKTRGKGRHGRMGASHAADHVVATLGQSGHSIAIGPASDWWYWLFQEFGTVRHKAQPSFRPAFDTQHPTAKAIVGRHLWAAIKGEAERNAGSIGGQFL